MSKLFNPFWFKPAHQPNEASAVEFQLKPLDQRTFMFMRDDIYTVRRKMRMGVDGVLEAFDYAVVGWRGLPSEFSDAAKREARTVADPDWIEWQQQIAMELFRRAQLGDPEVKNS